jgi:two-component system sensor kinase FixL
MVQDTLDVVIPSDVSSSLGPKQIKFLYSVLSVVPDAVAITDRSGDLVLCNPAMQRLIGIDPQGIAPKDWPEAYGLFLPNSMMPFPAQQFPLVRALAGEECHGIEIYVRNPRVPEGRWMNVMSRPLADEAGTLWGGVIVFRDISEYRRLEKEILDISGREQRRIGQDLHDGLCQILTGIRFMCSAALRKISDKGSPEAGSWTEVQTLVSQALREADNVAKGLYPVELEVNGLMAALRALASQTRKLYQVSCVFVCDRPIEIQDRDVAIHIYRIGQEAIANAIKHGQAKNITLWLSGVDGRFSLIVKNDGTVPGDAPLRQGMGWRIMNYRAEMIGAHLQFEFDPSGHFVLTCEFQDRVPVPPMQAPTPFDE